MPKKTNAYGMQEYIPAGNGDASGEYADGEGSNRHFTAFKKPEKETETTASNMTTPNKNEEVKTNEGKLGNTDAFSEYINNTFKAGKYLSKEDMVRDFNSGNEEAKRCVSFFVGNGDITYKSSKESYYSPNEKQVYLNTNDSGYRRDGETFYHESGHAVDYALGEKKSITSTWGSFTLSREEKNPMTETKITSNGKSLNDTIKEEMFGMKKDGRWNAIKNEYVEFKKNGLAKLEGEELAEAEEYKKIKDEAWNYVQKTIQSNNFTKYIDYMKERDKMYLQYLDKHMDFELEKRVKEREEALKKENAMRISRYKTLSDIYGAAYKVSYGFANSGHSATYYKRNSSGASHEFFAEYFSARATGDTELIETTKKYMPETSKACEELYQYAISNRRNK